MIHQRKLLERWMALISGGKATIEPVKELMKFTKIFTGEHNQKLITELIAETKEHLDLPNQISPYNPAHGLYGECCGIFCAFNDEGIIICNECNMTINELVAPLEI